MADYIKREDLLDLYDLGGLEVENAKVPLNVVIQNIKDMPSADVRPVVRGKWLPDYDYAEYDFDGSTPLLEPIKFQDGWQCSLCGHYMPSEENFCPNCGAQMEES